MTDVLVKPKFSLRARVWSYAKARDVVNWVRKTPYAGKIVYPNKSISNTEIRQRVRNKSLSLGTENLAFSDKAEIARLIGLSKIDLMRDHANTAPKLALQMLDIDKKANTYEKKKAKEEEERRIEVEIAKRAEIAKAAKSRGDGQG